MGTLEGLHNIRDFKENTKDRQQVMMQPRLGHLFAYSTGLGCNSYKRGSTRSFSFLVTKNASVKLE